MKPDKLTIDDIFRMFDMKPLPVEGGWFTRPYLSEETITREALPERYSTEKPFGTAILYLLTPDPNCFSAMHVLPTDEVYHFYLGDPVEMLQLFPDGSGVVRTLGADLLAGQLPQVLVPRHVWQGLELAEGGDWALMGTTMAPGYDPDDFEPGDRRRLIERYPSFSDKIANLTPEN